MPVRKANVMGATVKHCKKQDGFALVLTLVFLSIFLVASLGVSFISHVQTRASIYIEDKARAYFLAREGLVRAVKELSQLWAKRQQHNFGGGGGVWKSWSSPEGHGLYLIQNERGKLNLNTATSKQITDVLSGVGIDSSKAGVIRDSILDWIDGDSSHRTSGAESDFYQQFFYEPRNAPFKHLGELALIRGVNPQLLWGDWGSNGEPAGPALWGLFTMYEEGKRIEVNSASAAVLSALPGLSQGVIDQLIKSRKSRLLTRDKLRMIMGDQLFHQIEPNVTTTPSRFYTIVSKAVTKGDKSRHSLLAVVEVLPGGGVQHHYWLDDLWCGTTNENNQT